MSHPPVPPQPDPEEDIIAEANSEDQGSTSIFAFDEEVSESAVVDPRKPPGT